MSREDRIQTQLDSIVNKEAEVIEDYMMNTGVKVLLQDNEAIVAMPNRVVMPGRDDSDFANARGFFKTEYPTSQTVTDQFVGF